MRCSGHGASRGAAAASATAALELSDREMEGQAGAACFMPPLASPHVYCMQDGAPSLHLGSWPLVFLPRWRPRRQRRCPGPAHQASLLPPSAAPPPWPPPSCRQPPVPGHVVAIWACSPTCAAAPAGWSASPAPPGGATAGPPPPMWLPRLCAAGWVGGAGASRQGGRGGPGLSAGRGWGGAGIQLRGPPLRPAGDPPAPLCPGPWPPSLPALPCPAPPLQALLAAAVPVQTPRM